MPVSWEFDCCKPITCLAVLDTIYDAERRELVEALPLRLAPRQRLASSSIRLTRSARNSRLECQGQG